MNRFLHLLRFSLFLPILFLWFRYGFAALSIENDFEVINFSINLANEDRMISEPFVLTYSNITQWENALKEYMDRTQINFDDQVELMNKVYAYLKQNEKYSDNLIRNRGNIQMIKSTTSLDYLRGHLSFLKSSVLDSDFNSSHLLYFTSRKRQSSSYQKMNKLTISDSLNLFATERSLLPDYFHDKNSRVVVYQTRNAFTGGTTAMRVLHNTLSKLGYQTFLCNDTNYNHENCLYPRDSDIAITGEWCQEVMNEYLVDPFPENEKKFFYGRGIQYYLGFHHARHYCRGWIPTSDSHYINQLLGIRKMHAFFLGCPMSEPISNRITRLLTHVLSDAQDEEKIVPIQKENLILIDYDFFKDYPPQLPLHIRLPSSNGELDSYEILFLNGNIPGEKIPYLLQRAKMVIDLGMPGPERISSEGILFGAIPVVSHRWNGASDIDFPTKYKINVFNFTLQIPEDTSVPASEVKYLNTEIYELIEKITQNYEQEIQDPKHYSHFQYILSMEKRLEKTIDYFFGSSKLHIVLVANTLEEETLAIFQILGLIYYYPMISIDLIVTDKLWFMKHHYVFIDLMIQSGYIRYDPHDPTDFYFLEKNPQIPVVSLLNIFNIHELLLTSTDLIGFVNPLLQARRWKAAIFALPIGYLPSKPETLFQIIRWADKITNQDVIKLPISRFFEDVDKKLEDSVKSLTFFKFNYSLHYHQSQFFQIILHNNDHYENVYVADKKEFIEQKMLHVCDLLSWKEIHSQENDEDLWIVDLIDNPPWLLMKSEIMEFTNNLCDCASK